MLKKVLIGTKPLLRMRKIPDIVAKHKRLNGILVPKSLMPKTGNSSTMSLDLFGQNERFCINWALFEFIR